LPRYLEQSLSPERGIAILSARKGLWGKGIPLLSGSICRTDPQLAAGHRSEAPEMISPVFFNDLQALLFVDSGPVRRPAALRR